MDLRDNAHDQLKTHVDTLRYLAAQDTPAQLVWTEMQRILAESATHLELFVIPKVEPVKHYLDILGRNELPTIAEYVPAAGLPERPDPLRPGTFLRAKGPNSEALMNGASEPVEAEASR